MMGMLDKKNKKEKDMAVGRLPPAGRGPSQAFGLAWASFNIFSYPGYFFWLQLISIHNSSVHII